MNANPKFLNATAQVDAGAVKPLPNSRKVYIPGSQAGVRVPMREITQSDTPASMGAGSITVPACAKIRAVRRCAGMAADSQSGSAEAPVTPEQEAVWAAFPVTPLRPEQVAGSVIQSNTLQSLDSTTHVFQKILRFFQTRDFVKRYLITTSFKYSSPNSSLSKRQIFSVPILNSCLRAAERIVTKRMLWLIRKSVVYCVIDGPIKAGHSCLMRVCW